MMISHRLAALKDLMQRYFRVAQSAWQARAEIEPPKRLPHELAFLPAHLELQDTPVSPIPRWSMRLIVLFGFIAILWATFGKIDVTATAQGKIIPTGKTKTIQPPETATVTQILVHDGQKVRAGQRLIELDSISTNADAQKASQAWEDARLAEVRAEALLTAAKQGVLPPLRLLAGISSARQHAESTLAQSIFHEYRARLATLDANIAQREAELYTTREGMDKLKQILPITRQRAADFEALAKQRFVSQHSFLEKEQDRIEKEHDFTAQQSRVRELQAALASARQQRLHAQAEFRNLQTKTRSEEHQRLAQFAQDHIKAHRRNTLMTLTAPVDGTVQQLAIHTVGGVVTAAQQLMSIVPDEDRMQIEAILENKDVGFVNAGQRATIKIETFPYTRYGTVSGIVKHVSSDAIPNEQKGLVFTAQIEPKEKGLFVKDTLVKLAPGMAVTVEIRTGKRRVISYFLEPLLGHMQESMRER